MLYKPTHFYIPCISGENFNHFEYCRIKSIEYIGDDECQCIYIDDPSHLYVTDDYIVTHNTTLLKFFHSAVIGWFPDDYSLFYSHSGDITRMYYDGVYQMVDDSLEYAWHDIFPDLKITSTNALMQQFNVGKYKPFPSLQTTSVGAKSAGKVRASKFLLTDDMIGSLEEALNKNYLDKMWGAYTVDALQRKTVDSNNNPCKEIMQATRWSTQDVIGRLIDIYEGNNRVRIISIPATDPETGDSNFDYAIGGFSKEFFAKQALLMDDVSYNCLYMQQPVEREGLLFPEEKIMRYKELPTSKIERITAQADTKSTGTDFFVLPVLIKYEGKDWQEVVGDGRFPEPLSLHENVDYVRSVLGNTVQFTSLKEDYFLLKEIPRDADFFRYQEIVNPSTDIVPSHRIIKSYIRRHGKDYRYQTAPNPVPDLRDRRTDNTSVGRCPNAAPSGEFFCN